MEEYLKILLEQIRYKKAKDMVGEEVKNHIFDQMEDNMHQGMTKEDAIEEAVKEMGDPVEAGVALDGIHRPQMALNLIILMGIISVLSILLHTSIGLGNSNLENGYIQKHILTIMVGFVLMMVVYKIDYSFMSKYGKAVGAIFLVLMYSFVFFGVKVNGATTWISFGAIGRVSITYLMYLYIPIFAAILYQYHGQGRKGILKSIIWMIVPCFYANRIPSLRLAVTLFFAMSLLLSIAVWVRWFKIKIRRFLITYWSLVIVFPLAMALWRVLFDRLAPYQYARIMSLINGDSYISNIITELMKGSKLIGSSGKEVVEFLPYYNSNYVLTFISSYYGIFMTFVVVAILLFIIYKIFQIAFRQKNQLGMIMGTGCGIVFLLMTVFNVLENSRIKFVVGTSLPFFSYDGTNIIVSYILIGIVLSIYRYKNILPHKLKQGNPISLKADKI